MATSRRVVTVEILYFDGCPHHQPAASRLDSLLARLGIDASIELRAVTSHVEAQQQRFLGSPTVRINGVDVEPHAIERTDFGLKCRLYPRHGGVAGVPPDEWLLDAIRSAAG